MDHNPHLTYYKLNRIFLQLLGIWPGGNLWLKRLQAIVSYGTILSSLFTQFATLSTSGCTFDNFLSTLAIAIPCCAAVMKYTCFLNQAEHIRELITMIHEDWDKMRKDREAFRIMQQYAEFTRLLSAFIITVSSICSLAFISYVFLPQILDIVAPVNESRIMKLPFPVEYFFDQEKYILFIRIHISLTFTIGVFTIISTELALLVYVQHVCGMFKITGYKLDHITDGIEQKADFERDRIVHSRIVRTVKTHTRAIRLVEFIWSIFATSYVILILIGVGSLSINMFRFFKTVETGANFSALAGYCTFFGGQFMHLFVCNFFAQRLIDHSAEITDKTYNIPWYGISHQSQKLILFILQRSIKKSAFVAASVFTASLEGFTTLAGTSFSYFTVIYSML